MKVLSLFDGISCGMVALERAGIKVDEYYASEIEESAITISKNNYPNIVRLGDVTKWKEWDIDWSSIDLLIGGSPCQGFSKLGKELNFNDPRSKLFFTYVEILNHIKTINPNVKFLLENVNMRDEYKNVITNYLGVDYIRFNSKLLAAAQRDRLYWTNIPFTLPADKGITFDDINTHNQDWLSADYIESVNNWKSQQKPLQNAVVVGTRGKIPCLTARGFNQSHSGMILVKDGDRYRRLTIDEAEMAMTVPVGYTRGVNDKLRAKALGNGWTVDVIAHIFKGLKED